MVKDKRCANDSFYFGYLRGSLTSRNRPDWQVVMAGAEGTDIFLRWVEKYGVAERRQLVMSGLEHRSMRVIIHDET